MSNAYEWIMNCISEKFCTWFANTAGDILLPSTSSGHLGQRILCQKLQSVSFSACESNEFPLLDVESRLDTGGHSKVLEQLGHDSCSGSQPRYLQVLDIGRIKKNFMQPAITPILYESVYLSSSSIIDKSMVEGSWVTESAVLNWN